MAGKSDDLDDSEGRDEVVRRIVRETVSEMLKTRPTPPPVPAVPAVPPIPSESLTQASFRTDAELLRKVKAKLALEGRSLQDLLNGFLHDWVNNEND